jgi:hypothetical protein
MLFYQNYKKPGIYTVTTFDVAKGINSLFVANLGYNIVAFTLFAGPENVVRKAMMHDNWDLSEFAILLYKIEIEPESTFIYEPCQMPVGIDKSFTLLVKFDSLSDNINVSVTFDFVNRIK